MGFQSLRVFALSLEFGLELLDQSFQAHDLQFDFVDVSRSSSGPLRKLRRCNGSSLYSGLCNWLRGKREIK